MSEMKHMLLHDYWTGAPRVVHPERIMSVVRVDGEKYTRVVERGLGRFDTEVVASESFDWICERMNESQAGEAG